MEIKLRKKGLVITVQGFTKESIPQAINVPEGLEGIDLTGYSVIYSSFGRRGLEKAKALRKSAPGVILVYRFDGSWSFGEGIMLPQNFNPARVRFYRTTEQEKEERKRAAEQMAKNLQKEILSTVQGVKVTLNYSKNGVEISPNQEAFANGWEVTCLTLVDALAGIEKMRPMWKEWNGRALELHFKHGLPKPEKGSIQIFPSPCTSSKVGVMFNDMSEPLGSREKWFILEKNEDGVWNEVGVSWRPPQR